VFPLFAEGNIHQSDAVVRISNLALGVTKDDLKELCQVVALPKEIVLLFDPNGESRGISELTFSSVEAAQELIRAYNGIKLDGLAMKVEAVSHSTFVG